MGKGEVEDAVSEMKRGTPIRKFLVLCALAAPQLPFMVHFHRKGERLESELRGRGYTDLSIRARSFSHWEFDGKNGEQKCSGSVESPLLSEGFSFDEKCLEATPSEGMAP